LALVAPVGVNNVEFSYSPLARLPIALMPVTVQARQRVEEDEATTVLIWVSF
jgi:hypothetical protein